MKEQKQAPNSKMPAGTPWSGQVAFPAKEPDGTPVTDPPVPNRAHTEMRTDFPPELPLQQEKKNI